MTKRAKRPKSRKQNEAWEAFAAYLAIGLAKVVVFGVVPLAVLYGLVRWIDPTLEVLRFLTAGLVYCGLLAFLAGVQYGRTQSDGVIEGIDRGLEALSRAVDLRDTSRERRQRPGPVHVVEDGEDFDRYLPRPPVITVEHRELTSGDRVDL